MKKYATGSLYVNLMPDIKGVILQLITKLYILYIER